MLNLLLAYFLLLGAVVPSRQFFIPLSAPIVASSTRCSALHDADAADPSEIVAKKIVVKGDVQGGYYRACVLNEVGENGVGGFHFLIADRQPSS
jgi:hypothetical protein